MPIVYLILGLVAAVAAFLWFLFRFRIRGKHFDSNGVRIHYTDEGNGTPIILVHGFAVNADLNWRWGGCVRKLRNAGYRVIMLDVRGHGLSDKPRDPAAYGTELSDDIVRLMDHLGIPKAHVAGYSMGGFITMKTIERHPERLLSGIVCGAGWSELNEEILALFKEIVTAMEQRRSVAPITHWLEVKKRAPEIQCKIVDFVVGLFNDLDAIVNVFRTFEALSVPEEALRKNTVPTLVLVGTKDGIRVTSDQLPGLMQNLQLVYIEGGDHLSTVPHPVFMRSMVDFLRATDAQTSPSTGSSAQPATA